ncbi:MAG: DinB family protein [Chloroflexota bacterium]|nr:DinB family protein [Chloroflexota bacterium]MDQ5865812.1 DinB family protein [Chloroflexota bacterium]
MYNLQKDLLDAFKSTSDTLRFLLREVTQEQAAAARGGDENWSVVEVMCHLRDAEERALERLRAMRDETNPFLPGYDQEAWARERNYAAQDLQDALAAFLRLREEHINDLSALSTEDWERPGTHQEQGNITIFAHTLHMVAHDSQHAAQLARQLA